MGVFEGSLSFKTFYVEGEPPNGFHQDYLAKLQKHFFVPLTPVGEEDRSVGWVPVQDPIAESFTHDQVFFNQYVVFGMRIDKWALPSAWVKAMTRQAIAQRLPQVSKEEAKILEDDGKLRTKAKLSKREKDKIKLEIITLVKQHILTSMKVIDVCWNIAERKLRFWSQSQAVCDEFAELFKETFGLEIHEDCPLLIAKDLGMTEKQLDAMVDLDPWYPSFES